MKHILFDTDGVVVHSDMWSNEYVRRNHLSTDIMVLFFRWAFQDCLIGKADLKESIAPYLPSWWWTGSASEYLDAWFAYENHIDTAVIEKVRTYRQDWIQCHIATNQEKYRLAYLRNQMGFNRDFDSVFCSAEIGSKKPDTEFFMHILSTLGADPSDIWYFDDAVENIESAKKIGINAILYHDIFTLQKTIIL